jgi:glycosyltransferase involved in cell wall biosynthesis
MKPYVSFSNSNGKPSLLHIAKSLRLLFKNKDKVQKVVEDYRPVAVISNSMVSHLLNGLLSKPFKYNKIMDLETIVQRSKMFGIYGKGLDYICSKMDWIVPCSDAVSSTLKKKFKYKIKRIYEPVPKRTKKKEKPKNSVLKVGMFARYTPWKGHEDLVNIAHQSEGLNIKFVCYGNVAGKDKDYFNQLFKKAEGLENVEFNGFAPDIYDEMSNCDVILHLSKLPEPFGRVISEANACGTPVFAYEGGVVDELFANLGLAGQVFKLNDWKSIANSLAKFDSNDYHVPELEELYPENYTNEYLKVIEN